MLLKEAIDSRTGRGVVKRVLRSTDDIKAIEKVLGYIAVLIEGFEVSDYGAHKHIV